MTLHGKAYRVLGSGTFTVTTAGTPVQLTAGACQEVLLEADVDNGNTILYFGDANIDALSDPPRGNILFPSNRERVNCKNANEIYVDSTVNGGKGTYTLYG